MAGVGWVEVGLVLLLGWLLTRHRFGVVHDRFGLSDPEVADLLRKTRGRPEGASGNSPG